MELTLKSDVRRFEKTGDQSGFSFTFTYQVEQGQTKPESVTFYGNKPGETVTQNENINGNVSQKGKSINYSGTEDENITKAVFSVCKTILTTNV